MNVLNQRFPGSYVSLNNAMSQLQEDDVIEDVYEEDDVLTAMKHRHDSERNGKWVDNRSGDMVVLMDKNNRPMYVEPSNEQYWEFGILDLYPRLVVFR